MHSQPPVDSDPASARGANTKPQGTTNAHTPPDSGRHLPRSGHLRCGEVGGRGVLGSRAQGIETGRQAGAEVIGTVTAGRVPGPLQMRIDRAPRAVSLRDSEMPSMAAAFALINGLAETAQLPAGQPVKQVAGSSRAH